jgi:hypothetical protein
MPSREYDQVCETELRIKARTSPNTKANNTTTANNDLEQLHFNRAIPQSASLHGLLVCPDAASKLCPQLKLGDKDG